MKVSRLVDGQFFGACELANGAGDVRTTITSYSPHTCLPSHAHTRPYISIVLDGEYVERVGQTTLACTLLALRYHPADEEHANEFGATGGRCLNLELGGRWQESLERFPRSWHRPLLFRDAGAVAVRLTRAARLNAGHRSRSGRSLTNRWQQTEDALDLESLVAELLSMCEARLRCDNAAARAPAVRRAIDFIESHLAKPLSLTAVASVAGLHPTHFARSFRALTGSTVGGYVRRRRVARAEQLLLSKPADTVSRVAAEAGFADHAHLTRTFKRAVGMVPSSYRSAMIEEGIGRFGESRSKTGR